MPKTGCRAGYIPPFNKETVQELVDLAGQLVPAPYLFWSILLDKAEWKAWQEKRCSWLPGRPPLGRVIRQAWATGILKALEAVEQQKPRWQGAAWRLERFGPDEFGRFSRFAPGPSASADGPTPADKKIARAERALKDAAPGAILRIRDALGASGD